MRRKGCQQLKKRTSSAASCGNVVSHSMEAETHPETHSQPQQLDIHATKNYKYTTTNTTTTTYSQHMYTYQ